MKLKQITVPIENSHDRLYAVTRMLADRGIDLRAINLVDTQNFGELRILVSDVAGARQALMQNQIPARVDDVLLGLSRERQCRDQKRGKREKGFEFHVHSVSLLVE